MTTASGLHVAVRRPPHGGTMLRSRSLIGIGVVGALTVVATAQPEQTPSEAPHQPPPPAAPAGEATATATPAAPTTGTVRGRVLDKQGHPIAGAVITLGQSSAISDGDGKYTLEGVAAGAQKLAIEATGYATRESSV